jgi:DNA-binding GntR family transcriptional regulator
MESLIAPKTLVDQAYAVILDAISDGTLKPGERLTQDSVAQRLNVSRQPIHNALLVLKAQGFVREAGRRGLAVAPLDPKLFEAIYQFRSAIEPLAVRLAIPFLTEESKERGRAIIERGAAVTQRSDRAAIVQADMDFHSLIYELSGNLLVIDAMRLNWQHLRRAMGEVLRLPALSGRVWREHREIFEAMTARDEVKATRLMQDHMINAYKDVRLDPPLASKNA